MSDQTGKFDYDLAVVGGGSAGYAAARTAAAAGLNTAVIEGGKEVGGLCILRGCMPTKTLLYASEVLHLARHAGAWGLRAPEIGFDFAAVMARKNALIREFAEYRAQQLSGGSFKFIRATARFVDPHTVALDRGGRLTAAHFVISTGSAVSDPPLRDLKDVGYLTSDHALALTRLPRSLLVLGGGPVAVEFAQFFARFDVKVTLVQRSEQVLRGFDADAAETLERVFRREGIVIHTNTRLKKAWIEGRLKLVAFDQFDSVPPNDRSASAARAIVEPAEEILYALGRKPETGSLGLGEAGVACDAGGRILTNPRMQTSAPHIYAAGDCTGPHEIVHIANQQGEIAAHNVAYPDRPRSLDYRLFLSVVFTDPQIATAGLTAKEARQRNIPFLSASYPFNDHGKSLIMEAKDGFVKLLADPKSGEILGGCCTGPMGGELIHEIVAAMARRMTVGELAALPHYHPTLAEIWTYPAEELAAKMGRATSAA
jgi:pyruvate/2-oxoglutarate dehydrogenase complex dihydrolipoamide dehydrogenase (E3) component